MSGYNLITETDFGTTNQRNYPTIGLMDYDARFYSPYLNRWTQPDTIIPNLYDPQSLNRYAYVRNNPVKYTDPSGHIPEQECGFGYGSCGTGFNKADYLDYMLESASGENYCDVYPHASSCRSSEVEDKLKKTTNNENIDWSSVQSGLSCDHDEDPGLCLNMVMAGYYWLAGIDIYSMAQNPPFQNPLPDMLPEEVNLNPWLPGILLTGHKQENMMFLEKIRVDPHYIWNYEYNYIEALRYTYYQDWLVVITRPENDIDQDMLEEIYPTGGE